MEINFKMDDSLINEEEMLAYLITQGDVFLNNGHWKPDWPKDKTTLHVICNDVFAWGCADAEDLDFSEISVLYQMVLKDPIWGAAAFCIMKRKMQPQKPVADKMNSLKIWNIEELINGKFEIN